MVNSMIFLLKQYKQNNKFNPILFSMTSDWSSSGVAFTNAAIYFPNKRGFFHWGQSNTKANKTQDE